MDINNNNINVTVDDILVAFVGVSEVSEDKIKLNGLNQYYFYTIDKNYKYTKSLYNLYYNYIHKVLFLHLFNLNKF